MTASTAITATPDLEIIDGQITTTSVQVSQHFSKQHKDVLRAVRNLLKELPEEHQRNFALTFNEVAGPNGATRKEPAYRLTRDGFTLLAMGFTGKEALQWKLAYISAFNKMEQELLGKHQPTPYTLQHSDTLSEPQQIALRAMLESNVKRLPHAKQAGAMIKGWSKLKAHFGVPYRQIPASEFTEALSIIARHVSEWELVEDAAKQPEAAPKPSVFMQALAAARENALSYMNGYRQAVQSGQPGPRMADIPGALLEGIVAEALMNSRFLAGFDPRTGQMHVQLVPQDASVFSFQSGDFGQAISAIPTRRLPELQDALSKRVARHLGSLGH